MFPPFDPDRDERKKRPNVFARGQVPVRVLIPNIFTLVGLCAGLTAIRMGIEHRWDLAVAALVFAAVLDGIDGRVARLLKASSRFGAELDSLADFVNFGVAPAIIMFNWALEDLHSLGWIAVLVFAVCSALRLARFNVSLDATDTPAWKSNYFVGVPAPAGAIILLLPIYVQDLGLHVPSLTPLVLILYPRHRAVDGEQGADLLGQADRAEDRARIRFAGVRSRGAVHGAAGDVPGTDAGGGLDPLSGDDPGLGLSLSRRGAQGRQERQGAER